MKTITIMIPAYNEEAVLPQLFARLADLQKTIKKYRLELLFINDGSSDDTLKLIKQEAQKNRSISYVNLSRNFGKETGMLAGFDYAKGDALVIIDADLQDPPELIPQMIELQRKQYRGRQRKFPAFRRFRFRIEQILCASPTPIRSSFQRLAVIQGMLYSLIFSDILSYRNRLTETSKTTVFRGSA